LSLQFVLATHNAHKIDEFRTILGSGGGGGIGAIDVIGYDGPEPTEDGASFADNALIKARAAALHTGLPSLADDSGLCVDVMNGAPGIFSARWAGVKRGDAANRSLLLEQLEDVPDHLRTCYYVCVIAVVIPDGEGLKPQEFVVEGRWSGTLTREPRGSNGFGYDPIFLPRGSELTAAEMDPATKNAESHRARALVELQKALGELAS
jgi:XTP/dITP diphosphohydrolase